MNKLFYYTREIKISETETKKYLDCFNLEKVIRTHETDNGGRTILLDDFHEEVRMVDEVDTKRMVKTGKQVKSRETYYTNFDINKEDSERFVKLTNLE